MIINKHVKDWYMENYDTKEEKFYIENAKWLINNAWITGCKKHGMACAIIAGIYGFFNAGKETLLFDVMLLVSALTIAFFFYAIREYDANDSGCSVIMYVCVLLLLFFTKSRIPEILLWPFGIFGMGLYFYLTFIKQMKLRKEQRDLEYSMQHMDEKEEKADKERYERWEEEYKSYRYGLPHFDIPTNDPRMREAKKLFEGYIDSKETLKNRYRVLVKQYHPDNGGDSQMFQCISEVFEKIIESLL